MRHRQFYTWSIVGLALITIGLFVIAPVQESSAQRLTTPYGIVGSQLAQQIDIDALQSRMQVDSVITHVSKQIASSTTLATARTRCHLQPSLFQQLHNTYRNPATRSFTSKLASDIEAQASICDSSENWQENIATKAQILHAKALLDEEQFQRALDSLNRITSPTPIDDFILLLKARAYRGLNQFDQASHLFRSIYQDYDTSLRYEALTQLGHSLADAKQWPEALEVLGQVVHLFPDYPRRHRAMYQYAQALDYTGNKKAAVVAYQQAWFEFPFKKEGRLSRKRLRDLVDEGFQAPTLAPEVLLARYHQLRVDKYWPLVEELLHELKQQYSTDNGWSPLENEINLQLAMNAYHSHQFDMAVEYFEQVQAALDNGFEEGIETSTLFRYYSRSLARLNRHGDAIVALERLHLDSTPRTRLTAIASYYEDHGHYEKAFDIYEEVYTARDKRGWHYAWLLYKTGRLEKAHESLVNLANRSRGELRAQYMYWAARSLERAGLDNEAGDLFREVSQTYGSSYYGIQAHNRLIDLEQRQSVDTIVLAQADQLLKNNNQIIEAFDAALARGYTPVPTPADPRSQPLIEDMAPVYRSDAVSADLVSGSQLLVPPVVNPMNDWSIAQRVTDNWLAQTQPVPDDIVTPGADNDELVERYNDTQVDELAVQSHSLDTIHFAQHHASRIDYTTQARIYWNGRHNSDLAFVRAAHDDELLGPVPQDFSAYDTMNIVGALHKVTDDYGDLFPNLERTAWLWDSGLLTEARRAIRDVALEFRALSQRPRPTTAPHELPLRRWDYLIDNRRQKTGLWGMQSDELRFPVPDKQQLSTALLERQQAIYDAREDIEAQLIPALQEVGEYHLVRRHALSKGGWIGHDPHGATRDYWVMAYPRAFPDLVIPQAQKHGINPYIIWALMLVESSFNPDSLSRADAMGLLQVIPRTGVKIAAMFGDEEFGPFDLLDENQSIEQGVFYFSKLIKKFYGQELFAFAGYNGGPHRVAEWLDQRGNMPLDEFIEEIPFRESRGYAKKVLRFVNLYLKIYENSDDLYVGQNIRRDYRPQPDF